MSRGELVGFAGGRLLGCQRRDGAVHQRQGPLAIEDAIRHGARRIGDLEFGGRVRARAGFDGEGRLATSALGGVGAVALVGQEMLHRPEQKGTEAAPARLHGVEAAPGQQAGKELLSEVARGVFARTPAADELEDRLPVGGAEFAQRGPRLGGFAARAQDLRPARWGEMFGGLRMRRVAVCVGGVHRIALEPLGWAGVGETSEVTVAPIPPAVGRAGD